MNPETRQILLRGGLTLADLWSGPCKLPEWESGGMRGSAYCAECEHRGHACKLPAMLTTHLVYHFAAWVEQCEYDAAHPETVEVEAA